MSDELSEIFVPSVLFVVKSFSTDCQPLRKRSDDKGGRHFNHKEHKVTQRDKAAGGIRISDELSDKGGRHFNHKEHKEHKGDGR